MPVSIKTIVHTSPTAAPFDQAANVVRPARSASQIRPLARVSFLIALKRSIYSSIKGKRVALGVLAEALVPSSHQV